jgi:uncharacterized protein with GYD domain
VRSVTYFWLPFSYKGSAGGRQVPFAPFEQESARSLQAGMWMAAYVILSRFLPDAFRDPRDFKKLAETVSNKFKTDCRGLEWKHSFATLGRFDVVEVVETDDPKQVETANMIIRAYGHSTTETLVGTPWKEFLARS